MRSETSTTAKNVSSLTSSVKCGFHRIRKWYRQLRQELKKPTNTQPPAIPRDPVDEVLEEFAKMLSYFEEEELQNMENENAENEQRELAAKLALEAVEYISAR